jgi:hypothetical protein
MTKKNNFHRLFHDHYTERPLFLPVLNGYAAVLQHRQPELVFHDPTLFSNGLIQAQRVLDFDGFVLEFPFEEFIQHFMAVSSKEWEANIILQTVVFQNLVDVLQRIKVVKQFIPVLVVLPGPLTALESIFSLSESSGITQLNDLEIMGEIISEIGGQFAKQQVDALIIKDSQASPIKENAEIKSILTAFLELTGNISSFYKCELIYVYSQWEEWLKQVPIQGLVLPIEHIQNNPFTHLPYTLGSEIDLSKWVDENGEFNNFNPFDQGDLSHFILTKHPVPQNCNPVHFRKWIDYVRN